jgi:hypothetical protein
VSRRGASAPAAAAPTAAAPPVAESGPRVKRTHQTAVGTTVEIVYRVVDGEHARIESYRRKKRGHETYRRAPEEEGLLVRLDQLPFPTTPPQEEPW